MPIASTNPNSYQELQFKPFSLNYSAALQEASAKNQYWQEGASKIQAAYKKIVDLAPNTISGKKYLQEFTEQVKGQIKNIAKSNIAIQGNADQINQVIAPLYDTSNPTSELILTDDYMGKYGKNLIKTINSFKTKDKGAQYSPDNEKYATEWYQNYLKKAQDPNASLDDLKELKSSMKEYTPYYDYQKELETAISKCPKNSTSGMNTNSMYFTTSTTTTVDVGPCVQSFLSDKAKSQIGISGYVHYGKNYEALGQNIMQLQIPTINEYNESLGKIAADLTSKTLTKEQKESLLQQQSTLNLELSKLNANNLKIANGDYSDIENNYESYASYAYQASKVSQLQRAFSSRVDKNEVEVNPFAMLERKLQAEAIEAQKDRNFTAEQNAFKIKADYDMARIRANGDKKGKDGDPAAAEIVGYGTDDGSTDIKQTKESFYQEGTDLKFKYQDARLALFNLIKTKEGTNVKMDNVAQAESYVREVLAAHPEYKTNPEIAKAIATIQQSSRMIELWNQRDNNLKSKIDNKTKEVFNSDELMAIHVKKPNGLYETVKVKVSDFGKNSSINKNGIVTYKNDVVTTGDKLYIGLIDKVKNIKEEVYTSDVTSSKLWASNENLNLDKENIFRNNMLTRVNNVYLTDPGLPALKLEDVRLGTTDWQGNVHLSIPPLDKDQTSKVMEGLREYSPTLKKDGSILLHNVKEFVSPDLDPLLGQSLAQSMQLIKDTDYPFNEKVSVLSGYKGKYNVITQKSNPGLVFIVSIETGASVFETTNLTALAETLKKLP